MTTVFKTFVFICALLWAFLCMAVGLLIHESFVVGLFSYLLGFFSFPRIVEEIEWWFN